MKVFHRISVFLLLMLFVSESFGISKYVHFCGGEKTSESYFFEHKDCCCEDEEDEAAMSDCCKDEVKIVQNNNDEVLPVEKGIQIPSIDFLTLFFSSNSFVSITPIVNSSFSRQNSFNLSFDTSPPIRELVCCFIV